MGGFGWSTMDRNGQKLENALHLLILKIKLKGFL